MKKIFLLILLLVPMIILIGCSKSKQEIVDKCLLQANQTFAEYLPAKMEFFNSCMAENQYYYTEGKDGCKEYSEAYFGKLFSYCYEYKRGD